MDKPTWAEYPKFNQVTPPGMPYVCRFCGHCCSGTDPRDHSVACSQRKAEVNK